MRTIMITVTAMITVTITPITMTEPLPAFDMAAAEKPLAIAALQRLLAWLSPAFPVGAYSYSHGLEWAIEDGTVTTPADLQSWIADVLRHGGGRSDAILFAAAWRAARAGDQRALAEVAELAAALQPSRERHLETTAQGRAFLDTVAATWPDARLAALATAFPAGTPIAYPVAVAMAAASEGVPLRPALAAFAGGFVANLVSAGVRAIPIGQTDGQRIIAALAPMVEELARFAEGATPDDLGGAALRADIASMKHETQYTRLFRS
ncbi:MAG: urease accessory protein UreF [Rhizobiales bacterium]|nr:urease accessory protein UreF [Hyphomicrobiales bacterium]